MCIHLNPHVLEWNGMEFSLIPLQSTSTHVDWDEYMRIQTRPYRGRGSAAELPERVELKKPFIDVWRKETDLNQNLECWMLFFQV